jgi:hypothetical protein
VNPAGQIEESKKNNPQLFSTLSSDLMQSLQSQLEVFEDFDVVIDGTPPRPLVNLGPSAPCVGQDRLKEGTLYHVHEIAKLQPLLSRHELAVVGDGKMAAEALKRLSSWWKQGEGRIFLITNSSLPFEEYLKESSDPTLQAFLWDAQKEEDEQKILYEKALVEWQKLDDFIKAKKPKPELPIPRLVFFAAHILSCVDQLIDKSRTFLTLEASPWVKSQKHPENNLLDIKTIGVDFVVPALGSYWDTKHLHGLDIKLDRKAKSSESPNGVHPEVGFYSLNDQVD